MKKGWEIKKIGDVLQKTETVNPLHSPNTQFDYIDVSSISNETFQIEQTQRLKGKDAPSRARKRVRTNDILFATIRPTLQRIAIVPDLLDNQVCSTGYFVLRAQSEMDHRFIFYSLFTESFTERMESLQKGASYPAVTDSEVRAQDIPVPPFAEQRRIVGVLDEAFAALATAKAHAEQNLLNARALFAIHLQSVFSHPGKDWVETTVGDLCDFLNGFAFKSGDAVAHSATQLVRMGNLYGSKLDLNRNAVFYPDSFSVEYRRFVLNEGDIIMSLTGTTGKEDYGFAVRVPENDRALLMNQRIAKFDCIKEDIVCRDYLLHYLRSRAFLDILYSTANGTRQANLSTVTIKTLPFPLPPISEQKKIVSSLNALRTETQRLEGLYRQKLAALAELKKALLHRAFTGEL